MVSDKVPPALLQGQDLEQAQAFLEYLPYPVMLIGEDYKIRWLNHAGRETYGDQLGLCHQISHGYPEPCDRHGEPCPKLQAERTGTPASFGHVHKTQDSHGYFKVTALPLAGGGVLEVHVPLEEIFTLDALTGALSRPFFEQLLHRQLPLLERMELPYGLVMVDVDRLKGFNDVHGHITGDAVLRTVAQAIIGNIRTADSVGRMGGDEFCIFLPNADRQRAVGIIERVRVTILRAETPGVRVDQPITVSFGVFTTASQYDLAVALERADGALFDAKAAGRDCVVSV